MAGPAFFIYFDGSANTVALGATSADIAIPAGSEFVGISTTGNCHFRIGSGVQTAVATDPLITPNSEIQVVRVTGIPSPHIAVIQDAVTPNTGVLSVFKVALQ